MYQSWLPFPEGLLGRQGSRQTPTDTPRPPRGSLLRPGNPRQERLPEPVPERITPLCQTGEVILQGAGCSVLHLGTESIWLQCEEGRALPEAGLESLHSSWAVGARADSGCARATVVKSRRKSAGGEVGRAGSQLRMAEVSTGGRRMQGGSEGRDSRDT